MVTVDELSAGHPLPAPIVVEVVDVEWQPQPRRRAVVDLVDTAGNPLRLVDYDGANLSVEWRRSRRYRIADCAVRRGGGDCDLQLAPSTRTTVDAVDSTERSTRLLVVGDTHVGYRHRPRHEKPRWAREVDNRDTFERVFRRARDAGVDAVIHAGDVFDHETTRADLDLVRDVVTRTCDRGIGFHFVRGNHDMPPGRRALRRLVHDLPNCTRLTTAPTTAPGDDVHLYGLDHTGRTLPPIASDRQDRGSRTPNVLVVHDTPYPVVDDGGTLRYNRERLDLRTFLSASTLDLDLLVAGHMHVGSEGVVRGHDLPVLTTGPTAPISDATQDNDPSTWLVTVVGDRLVTERRPL